MEPFKHHLFVCNQSKPEGAPSCPAKGGVEALAALNRELKASGLESEVQVTECGCLGLCSRGPNLIVYPEGAWYCGVSEADIPEIVNEHLKGGRPVSRLLADDGPSLKKAILEHRARMQAMKELLERGGMMPEEINRLMRGFMESRIVLTAIELDLFTHIGEGGDARAVAEAGGLDLRATQALLNSLAAIGVIAKRGETYINGPLVSRYFVRGSPDDSREAAMHVVHLWHRWSTLTECMKTGAPVSSSDKTEKSEDQTRAFIAAMHKNASFSAGHVIPLLELQGVKRALDIGGGSGAYSIALARKRPDLEITIFDLPPVIELAKQYIRDAGLEGEIKTRAGDMMSDDLGQGYDLALLFAICHMWSPEENQQLFKRILAALNPGGQLVIQDFVLNEDKTKPGFGVIFAINMLVNTRGGGTYSAQEYKQWLSKAGFLEPVHLPLPGPADLVTAKKAGDSDG